MARIALVEGNQRIPEGTYVFRCEKVSLDKDTGMVELSLVTKDGQTHNDRYYLVGKDGSANRGAQMSFSFTARALMCDPDAKEVETQDLCGKYMKATVVYDVRKDPTDDSKTKTYVTLKDKISATGYDSTGYDLNALLG